MLSTHGPVELVALFKTLAPSENVSYILSDDRRILRTNAAWDRFAAANGGEQFLATWRRGTSLIDVIPEPLKAFYVDGFSRACTSGERWEHDYECSSPDTYRLFRMIVYPFGESCVVTHSLRVERTHDRDEHAPSSEYVNDGVVVMCAHCRRVRGQGPERWDWVPAYVARPVAFLSHGLCAACVEYYYAA